MINFSTSTMRSLIIHKIGNKMRDEGFQAVAASAEKFIEDKNVEEVLLKYLLSPFKSKPLYQFFHETDLSLNVVNKAISAIFNNPADFHKQSITLLKHLYEATIYPQIRSGEFYLAYLSDCQYDDQSIDAIGIFKTETKDPYLKIDWSSLDDFSVSVDKGINPKKLDRGCIIFNTQAANGYRIIVVDHKKKNTETYWKEDFLKVSLVQDEYFQTENCLMLCKEFSDTVYAGVLDADKKDQILFLNDAIIFFSEKQTFDIEEFLEEVIKDSEMIKQFREFKEIYELNQGIVSPTNFEISTPAVKAIKRKFKGLIRLDTDIEIKVAEGHESQSNIERGFDPVKGMNYYKVFFNQEE